MKSEAKLRKELTREGAAVLIYCICQRQKPTDTWRPFYNEYVDAMLKGMDSGQRRRVRIGLASKGYIKSRIRISNRGRQEYLVQIPDECYKRIVSRFGPVEMTPDGKPIIPAEKVGDAKEAGPRTCLNSASLGTDLENCYTHDDELRRRAAKQRQAEKEQAAEYKEQKEHQREADRAAMKRLKEFGISGVSVEQIQEVI